MEISAISPGELNLLDMSSMNSVSQSNVKTDFSDLITNSVSNLNHSLVKSNQAIADLALGKTESTHELVLAMEEAKMPLQIAVEVRNKLVEAYQQITRMQIYHKI